MRARVTDAGVVRSLILLRHGQTEWNADDRMQGQIDTALTELGNAQAKQAAVALAMRAPAMIVTSDLTRAAATAAELGNAIGIPVTEDSRLRETHLGQWQGLTHLEVDAAYPGARIVWRSDATFAPPGGENRVDVARRALPVVDEVLAADPAGPIVFVAHGGLICALTAALLDLPVDRWHVLGGLGNASWVQLTGRDDPQGVLRWRLDVWNASARVASDVL